ncbi:hypothetical protein [Paenarthrobacter sp. PH39-S1]|uniref:mechanosensitive ion channel family protein n=1 Tax=Paenarthrobacter sp. PH39-S1 TaxID=3046204 RepID=UPI0024B8C01B|nr:hypothetical protein [Paenarthrobacter sp. PH39-S1]MDJ0358532.1 hypothetical protein [Paenarthrobacter sp. PH39-S1]
MNNALSAALADVITFVPKLIFFFIILIIGWIIAKLIEKALSKVLQKVGFDKAVERGGIKKALEKSKFDASSIVGKIVYYFILLFVLELAFGVFGPNPISTLLTGIIAYLPLVFVAIIIIVITFAIAGKYGVMVRVVRVGGTAGFRDPVLARKRCRGFLASTRL